MAKIAILASIATIVASLGIASLTANDAQAVTSCVTTSFKTQLAKDACTKGGQPAAKDAMKKFMKDAKIKSCNQCHAKLAPKYELKPDAVDQFKKAGGQLLAGGAAAAPAAPAGSGKGSAAKPAK